MSLMWHLRLGQRGVEGRPSVGDARVLLAVLRIDRGKMTEDFLAVARWLKSRPDTTGKLGAVGFCFGGGVVNQLQC